jgi:peptide chain release factor 1
MKWKAEIIGKNESDGGGIREAVVEVKGVGAYDGLKWESGVHRVQRVPATESKGRLHTSTVAVVVGLHIIRLLILWCSYSRTSLQVLPLAEEGAPEDELFSMEDVRVEVMRARGAGGQVYIYIFALRSSGLLIVYSLVLPRAAC